MCSPKHTGPDSNSQIAKASFEFRQRPRIATRDVLNPARPRPLWKPWKTHGPSSHPCVSHRSHSTTTTKARTETGDDERADLNSDRLARRPPSLRQTVDYEFPFLTHRFSGGGEVKGLYGPWRQEPVAEGNGVRRQLELRAAGVIVAEQSLLPETFGVGNWVVPSLLLRTPFTGGLSMRRFAVAAGQTAPDVDVTILGAFGLGQGAYLANKVYSPSS
jgi:hypothetical protein